MGGILWLGIDHAAARAGLEMAGIGVTPQLWAEVRQIEAGAREGLNGHGR